MSRAQLTSTVEQNTGGAVAPFVAGKNKIINGDFGIWQRGTSFTPAAAIGVYTTDRWNVSRDGSGATVTISQQTFTPGAAPVAGYEGTFFYRQAQSVAGSGGTYNQLIQKIEDVRQLAGQTITLSFWAKVASGTMSSAGFLWQSFGSGGSGDVYTNWTSGTVTTSWQRFTATVSLPSISGKTIGSGNSLGFGFNLPPNTTFTLDIWGVQLEAGSVATSFTTATGTLQGELAACQRYYYRVTSPNTEVGLTQLGWAWTTTAFAANLPFPVTMRIAPNILDYSNIAIDDYNGIYSIISSFTVYRTAPNQIVLNGTTSAALVANRVYWVTTQAITANGYIGLSAEL